ncbi:MAG TPA: hypothetical protein VF771_15425, partial [Longimicrobiaceae bacterium]
AQQSPPSPADGRGPLLGAALGISTTTEPGADRSRTTSSVELRAGWALSPSVALMVEGALHGQGGKAPETFAGSIDPASLTGLPGSKLVGTFSVLASVQATGPAGIYVRPGIGVARHTFGAYELAPSGTGTPLYMGRIAHEWGPAAGIAVGHDLKLPFWLPLQLEAVALWSKGEDSTGARWSAGLQLAHDIRF